MEDEKLDRTNVELVITFNPRQRTRAASKSYSAYCFFEQKTIAQGDHASCMAAASQHSYQTLHSVIVQED